MYELHNAKEMFSDLHRNQKLVGICFLSLLLLVVSSLQQAEAHSLVWGTMPNSVFEYSAVGIGKGESVDIDFSLTITALSSIPEAPTWPIELGPPYPAPPLVSSTLRYLENGSIFYSNGFSWLFGAEVIPALPINDWNFLSTIADDDTIANIETVSFQNSTHWGYTNTWIETNDIIHSTSIYLKENGVLQSFSGYHYDDDSGEIYEEIEVTIITHATSGSTDTTSSTSPPPSDNNTMLLAVGGIVGASVVVIVLIFLKLRQG